MVNYYKELIIVLEHTHTNFHTKNKMADSSAYLPLLRMSIAMQDNPDLTNNNVEAMDPERAAWLKEAMANLLQNPVDELKVAVKRIKDAMAQDDEQELTQALEIILSLVENIDLARDLHKVHGFKLVIDVLTNKSLQVQRLACQAVGTVVHNHPETQAFANELDCLTPLCSLLTTTEDEAVLNKCLFALLALIRHNDPALTRFVKEFKGFSLCLLAMERVGAEFPAANRKALSLLQYVLQRVPPLVCAVTAEHSFDICSRVLLANVQDVDCRQAACMFFQLYRNTPNVATQHQRLVFAALQQVLPVAKQDEDDVSVEICQDLLEVWKL